MRFIDVDEFKAARPEEKTDFERGLRTFGEAVHRMHPYASGSCAFFQRRARDHDKFRFVPAGPQPLQEQQHLVLTAAPFGFQVDQQRLHEGVSLTAPAFTSFPSLEYLRRTERAAICAIRAPR